MDSQLASSEELARSEETSRGRTPDLLRVEGLTVQYGALIALRDVSWQVRSGEIVSADIYFWDLPPFNSIPESNAFAAAFKKAYGADPDKSAALGAAAVQVWASAVEATKSLDKKTVAEAIRGKTIKGTVFGDASFLPNGQLQPRYVVFKVVDGKNAKLEALPQ